MPSTVPGPVSGLTTGSTLSTVPNPGPSPVPDSCGKYRKLPNSNEGNTKFDRHFNPSLLFHL